MEAKTYLFVGGPLDGQLRMVKDIIVYAYETPKWEPDKLPEDIRKYPIDFHIEPNKVKYKPIQITGEDKDSVFEFPIMSPYSLGKVLKTLIEFYIEGKSKREVQT